jgi:hypothetical protein
MVAAPPFATVCRADVCSGSSLCENSTRYKRTLNFEACGRAQSKKTQKFVLRSALRPNQISFSHSLGHDRPTRALASMTALPQQTDITAESRGGRVG